MNHPIRLATACCLLIYAASRCMAAPNVVIVIADDMAWNDCGAYGSRQVRTPNIDRLAKQGMTFTHAFTATAMCSPTRQQLFTGVFPVRNGAYPNHSRVKPGTKSIVHHLKSLGYRVGLIGKRHFGPRQSFPFAKGSEAFVTSNRKQPFCLVIASKHPHSPWTAGPGNYDPKALKLPPQLVDNHETRKSLAAYFSEITAFDHEVGKWMRVVAKSGLEDRTIFIVTTEQGPQFPGGKWTCYDYGLHVGLIIRWPGRVKPGTKSNALVQYVDILPTLVEAAGGKPTALDTGRAGAPDGGRGFDGRSFLAVLKGQAKSHNDYVYGVHTTKGIIAGKPYPIRSVRDRRYRYIRNLMSKETFQNIVTERDTNGYWNAWVRDAKTNPKAARLVKRYRQRPAEELYDLEKDPHELHNLAGDSKHAKRIQQMRARLDAWMKQQGDAGIKTELAVKRRGKKKRKKKKKSP